MNDCENIIYYMANYSTIGFFTLRSSLVTYL